MPDPVKVVLPDGRSVDGVEVGIDESTERWGDVKLQDGTTLRVKISIISAARANDAYDPQGNPMYSFNMTPVIVLADVPPTLRKKGN